MFNFGILGMNARNLLFIKKFNKDKDINLADDKLKTKQYLGNRGIPVSKLYEVIHDRKELQNFDFMTLPDTFVIKPNTGSKGRGILVVDFDKSRLQEKDPDEDIFHINKTDRPFKIGEKFLSEDELKNYMIDILDGKYSMGIGSDKVIIEEKLVASKGFSKYCQFGLADIRMITFNLIPVAAMVRVPTKISGGKANLAQGGIGFGIEVGTGKIKSMFFKGKIFKKSFPGEYADFYDKKISYWDDIMMFSSQIQYFVNLGYLALDWVITADGPKILELNARAGMSIQNVSNLRLFNRLKKLGDIKVSSPEKGVQIAKSLFCDEEKSLINPTKVLFLSQRGKLLDTDNNEISELEVQLDLQTEKNYVGKELYKKINGKKLILDLYENELKIKDIVFEKSDKIEQSKLILGTNDLKDFYIKPIHKSLNLFGIVSPVKLYENEIEKLKYLDGKMYALSLKFTLMSRVKPTNLLDELDIFISKKGDYNPIFEYKYDTQEDKDIVLDIQNEINDMKRKYFDKPIFKSKFAKIYEDLIQEYQDKIDLVRAYSNSDYQKIYDLNIKLFGDFEEGKLDLSKQIIFNSPKNDFTKLGPKLKLVEIRKIIRNYLKERGFEDIVLSVDNKGISRMSVLNSEKIKIRISNLAKFREKELYSTLAHEVDVHLKRAVNGRDSGWEILKSGTAYYTKIEEGLAVYKSFETLPEGFVRKGIYENYYYSQLAMGIDFKDLAKKYRDDLNQGYLKSFYSALRLKRGIKNTGIIDKGAIFLKDKVYLDGYLEVEKYFADGGKLDDLMIGKIKISDLEYII